MMSSRVAPATLRLLRPFSQSAAPSSSGGQGKSPSTTDPLSKVSGLTTNVVLKPESGKKVGPGASHNADYKVPEYFLYGRHSYHEAEIELAPFRCPQPSALKK
ncbi:uncharacterized protein LOC129800030 [Phlebotomus papatasi]|uniref:uncharacterized protein LOC129800030 n=1 Tax=Phlebotomus papatasi TaxID=29031 RepID=UPI0024838987|nr:uncharacterized protein LOC129800030 [Phlebotomus papatasi]